MADANMVSEVNLRIRSSHQRVIHRKSVVLDYSPWDAVTLQADGMPTGDDFAEDMVPDRPQVSMQPVRRVG